MGPDEAFATFIAQQKAQAEDLADIIERGEKLSAPQAMATSEILRMWAEGLSEKPKRPRGRPWHKLNPHEIEEVYLGFRGEGSDRRTATLRTLERFPDVEESSMRNIVNQIDDPFLDGAASSE